MAINSYSTNTALRDKWSTIKFWKAEYTRLTIFNLDKLATDILCKTENGLILEYIINWNAAKMAINQEKKVNFKLWIKYLT